MSRNFIGVRDYNSFRIRPGLPGQISHRRLPSDAGPGPCCPAKNILAMLKKIRPKM